MEQTSKIMIIKKLQLAKKIRCKWSSAAKCKEFRALHIPELDDAIAWSIKAGLSDGNGIRGNTDLEEQLRGYIDIINNMKNKIHLLKKLQR